MELAIINGTYRDSQSKHSSRKWNKFVSFISVFLSLKCILPVFKKRNLHNVVCNFWFKSSSSFKFQWDLINKSQKCQMAIKKHLILAIRSNWYRNYISKFHVVSLIVRMNYMVQRLLIASALNIKKNLKDYINCTD